MIRFGGAFDCFDWRSMENLPDPHDDVFIRNGKCVLSGQWSCGMLFTEVNGLLCRREIPAMAWAPIREPNDNTPGDRKRG